MKDYKTYTTTNADGVIFNIKTDDLERIEVYESEIIDIIMSQTYYCNDLTGTLWMFNTKLGDINGESVWIENIYPSNDLTQVECLVIFE
ncbi:MAG: hypothetical protein II670_13270 [Alphaproteobacteria bacterium]|nr:hypothetical protein [Alphaproteobacteria bacterium]